MLISWGKWIRQDMNATNFLQHHLLFNEFLRLPNGSCLTDTRLAAKGIVKVSDLMDNGNLASDELLANKFSLNGNDLPILIYGESKNLF